jgi:hypothetical protein
VTEEAPCDRRPIAVFGVGTLIGQLGSASFVGRSIGLQTLRAALRVVLSGSFGVCFLPLLGIGKFGSAAIIAQADRASNGLTGTAGENKADRQQHC